MHLIEDSSFKNLHDMQIQMYLVLLKLIKLKQKEVRKQTHLIYFAS